MDITISMANCEWSITIRIRMMASTPTAILDNRTIIITQRAKMEEEAIEEQKM